MADSYFVKRTPIAMMYELGVLEGFERIPFESRYCAYTSDRRVVALAYDIAGGRMVNSYPIQGYGHHRWHADGGHALCDYMLLCCHDGPGTEFINVNAIHIEKYRESDHDNNRPPDFIAEVGHIYYLPIRVYHRFNPLAFDEAMMGFMNKARVYQARRLSRVFLSCQGR